MGDSVFTIGNEMRMACSQLFGGQYKPMRTLFIPLCHNSHDRYSYNILIIITLLYHLYIQYEMYNLKYNKGEGVINGTIII